ncbi:MAG: DUF1190 domain-containing protein [Ignavibacteria bacterium]|nr:DUF1190 domain-containing protein [Ignavibacteria bacterium]
MKKSKIITLALVTSLAFFGCSKKEKKDPNEWSAQTDTENQGVVENYHHSSHISPFFWYWMATRNGYAHSYYGGSSYYHGFYSGPRTFGSHSLTGGRSVVSRSSAISRGGFGRTGHAFGAHA